MRAILVCVDYADLLAYTLPYNRHHFEEVWVVTSFRDNQTYKLVQATNDRGVYYYRTDAFYANGATFNKWAALEEGLDAMGRHGWLCLMDADVLWPKQVRIREWEGGGLRIEGTEIATCCWGQLITPERRMFEGSGWFNHHQGTPVRHSTFYAGQEGLLPFPPEDQWGRWPLHHNSAEWAGYSQIFHADDPVLGSPPWHEINWKHAGGADSFFQAKWPRERKIRPPFQVLHLGQAGVNWCGRVSPYLDGSSPPEADQRQQELRDLLRGRRGKHGQDRYSHEKLDSRTGLPEKPSGFA
jgi:hypothetical protein